MKAVRSSSHVLIVPSLSSSSHVFASQVLKSSNCFPLRDQVVTFNANYRLQFRNGDSGTESERQYGYATTCSHPLDHNFPKNIKEVTKIIDVEIGG
ncbi:hypothetical protein Tco_0295561 [Tanacetum coccineum]